MFTKTGRRSRGLERCSSGTKSNVAGGIKDFSSQICSRDAYDLTFPSQDSNSCGRSDPYGLNSSQRSRQLEFLHKKEGGGCDGGLCESKKPTVSGIGLKGHGSYSFPELEEFGAFEIPDLDFLKPKKVNKINRDPFEYNSAEESEFVVLPPRNCQENGVFEFSEQEDLWKSKQPKNLPSYGNVFKPSKKLVNSGIPNSRKREGNKDCRESDGFPGKLKKRDRGENRALLENKKKKIKTEELEAGYVELTTTLMETQEIGEMMEHEDEVDYTLGGLKKGQPIKIRRASLLSLLEICGTTKQRRLLRAHGMAKTITDAILGLILDDLPSNLAAAALFFILTSDGQDNRLLCSPNCIRFLIKLLKPLPSIAVRNKVQPIGSKLLGLCKSVGSLQLSANGTDSGATAITLKVWKTLVGANELKPQDDIDGVRDEPELNPKWISLLMMERACLSCSSTEEPVCNLWKTGGNFKEKLREFGGLDAVFEVARKCHVVMEECLRKSPSFAVDSKDISGLESLVILLKCLKTLENATFFSKDNQSHLLGIKGSFDGQQAPRTLTKLVLSVIKILSGVFLLRSSLGSSLKENTSGTSNGNSHLGTLESCLENTRGSDGSLLLQLQQRLESSQNGSCSRAPMNSNGEVHFNSNCFETKCTRANMQRMNSNFESMDSAPDPFTFGKDEFEPSKWDLLSGSAVTSLSQDGGATFGECKGGRRSVLISRQSGNLEHHHSQESSCSSVIDADKSDLADCLLTAVKVLINLTHDNSEGCRQIAACGGLEVISSLIAGHFPSFSSTFPQCDDTTLLHQSSSRMNQHSNTTLTDQELDFLVAILGLLVNLIEKDGGNRSRLATATVSLPNVDGSDSKHRQADMVSLLCSIFLANQGDSVNTGGEKCFSLEDADSMLLGQKEAEKMILEAYSALLLAFLASESKSVRNAIAEWLPNRNLTGLVPVLEWFTEFHLTLNVISPETNSAIQEVIESCRAP